MKKLTKEQVKEIKKLREKGEKLLVLARKFNVNPNTIKYHTEPEFREKQKEYKREKYKKLSDKEKKKKLESRKEYQRKYHKERYRNDKEFREKQIERVKKYQKESRK